jgi:hypothetical protein
MRLLGLPDALRKYGLEVVEVAGWKTRGAEFDGKPIITLRHWTAGPKVGKAPSLGVVTNGRSDLRGPLCQVLQERTGRTGLDRVYVVASGVANHAGTGVWQGVNSGNRDGTGNEIEWSGPGEAFPSNRRETSERVAAALLSLSGDPNGKYACEHREYATPPGRKVDTNLDGGVLRANVQKLLHPPKPPPTEEEEDMVKPLLVRLGAKHPDVLYMSSAREVHWVRSGPALKGYQTDMKMQGLSPDVCVLDSKNANAEIASLYHFVVDLPFIGDYPVLNGASTGTKEEWRGPWIKADPRA